MSTDRTYTRLARPPLSAFLRFSLWHGGDHLLQVRSTGFSEQYQRFNYSDMRAILITDSMRRLVLNVFWGGFSAVFFVIAGTIGITDPSAFPLLVLTLLFSAIAVWNTLLGPTCHVHLVTRVQTQRLDAVVRRRKAEKLIESLRPHIERAQADLELPTPAPETFAQPPPLPGPTG